MLQRTYIAKTADVKRKWYLIDAKDKVLGRVATTAARILRGKHKVIFTPHVDTGDMVVIINAEKIRVTGKKLQDKIYYRYSGYPSGQKGLTLGEMLQKSPTLPLEKAIYRMFDRKPLLDKVRKKLKIFVGEEHPFKGQNPIVLEVK